MSTREQKCLKFAENVSSIFSALDKATIFILYAKWPYDQGQAILLKAFVDTINDAILAIKNMIRRKYYNIFFCSIWAVQVLFY